MDALKRLFVREEAATAVEYAVMLTLILMAVFASVAVLGTETSTLWSTIDTETQSRGMGS